MKKDHIVLGAPLACSRMVAAERFKISPARSAGLPKPDCVSSDLHIYTQSNTN